MIKFNSQIAIISTIINIFVMQTCMAQNQVRNLDELLAIKMDQARNIQAITIDDKEILSFDSESVLSSLSPYYEDPNSSVRWHAIAIR